MPLLRRFYMAQALLLRHAAAAAIAAPFDADAAYAMLRAIALRC